jgi:hypothetical protein
MRKSIMLFEEKLYSRQRQSRDRALPFKAMASKRGSSEVDASEKGKSSGKTGRSLSRPRKTGASSRSLSRSRKVEGRKLDGSDKSPTAADAKADRKKMARSVGINSNVRQSFKVPKQSSLPGDEKEAKPFIKKKEDDPRFQKKLSRSTGFELEPLSPKPGLGSRKKSQDDLSLLVKRGSRTLNNSFTDMYSSTDLVAELRKSADCKEKSDKKLDAKDKSDRKPENKEKSDRQPRPKFTRRFSDDVAKSIQTPKRPTLRRQSMDESTLELFGSKKLTLKKVASEASLTKIIEKNDRSGDSGDALGAFTTWGGRGNKGSAAMKKSFTSSDGGVSDKDKSTKETANRKKSTEIQSSSDANKKKELAAQQSKKGTESTGSIKVGVKKKSVRKPNETATPVAASAIAVVQETGKGIRVSRLTICAVCIMYVVSLGLVGVLGFWLHMIIFPSDQNQVFVPTGGDSVNQKATVDDEVSVSIEAAVDSPTFAPSTGEPSVTALPTTTTQAPTVAPVPIKPSKQQSVEIKNPPADSITPTITAKPTSSSSPSTLTPSGLPSNVPSTSGPTLSPSTVEPTLSQYPSSIPSMSPSISDMPSLTPTGIPRCPDELLKTADLGADSLITMRYEVVPLSLDDPHGGLFCVSIEYEGNAGWIGFAVSGASRDPAFGRKEAIIGIPGVTTLVAVAPPGADVAVGQQVGTGMLDGPTLVNPGKYEIPAGK